METNDKKSNETNEEEFKSQWTPRTELGRRTESGKIKNISSILRGRLKLREPEIVDFLVEDLEEEIILIGGTPGKGGGKKRILSRRTSRMHKSGRRYKTNTMMVVGNRNGLVGVASGDARDTRDALKKAGENARLNIIEVIRGCGSWECGCGEPHSIPFKIEGKVGSVIVELLPAPKGVGLCVSDDVKKIMNLSGIRDVWIKTRGQTKTRENLLKAVYNALKNMHKVRIREDTKKKTGYVVGVI